MVLLVFPVSKVLQPFLCVVLCSAGILYILGHISWYLIWFLATNSSFWLVWASVVVLNVQHPQDHDFFVKSALIFSYCLEHIFFLPYKQFHFLSKIGYFYFWVLLVLSALWCYFFIFLLVMWSLLPLSFSISLLLLLWSVVLSIFHLWVLRHLYCLSLC